MTLDGRILLEHPAHLQCDRRTHLADCVLDSVRDHVTAPPPNLADLDLPYVHRLPTSSRASGLRRQRVFSTEVPSPLLSFLAPPRDLRSAADDRFRASLYAGLTYSMPLFAEQYGITLAPIAPVVHPWMKFKRTVR